jgi:[ribosomal protein S18]-alanine N-acetyltransferase
MPMVLRQLRAKQEHNGLFQLFFPNEWAGSVENPDPQAENAGGPSGKRERIECVVAFSLRGFEPGDLETLWRIDQECFSGDVAYSRPELEFFMRRRGSFTLVAIDPENQEIAGFIIAHGGATGHIITIDVVAAARRSGLGSQMLRAAEERLRIAGGRAVSLETAVDNHGALSFYKRHGYETIKTIPGYYSDGVDAFRLRKPLHA